MASIYLTLKQCVLIGTSGQIHAVGQAFEKLIAQADSLHHAKKEMFTLSPTFVEGSSQLLVEQHGPHNQILFLEDYFGYRQPHHDNRGAYTIRLVEAIHQSLFPNC